MTSGRFNWLILLAGGVICLALGLLGVRAGASSQTVPWFALAVGFLIGSVALRRMRLP